MISVKAAESVCINKTAIVFLTVIAILVGIIPAVLLVGRPEVMIFVAISALVGGYFGVKDFTSLATEKPSIAEFAIGSLSQINWGSIYGILLLLSYGVCLGGLYLIEFVASLLGFELLLHDGIVAFVILLIVVLINGGVGASMSAEEIAPRLYPNKAHLRSVFYELVTHGKRRLASYIGFTLFVLCGILAAVWYTTGTLAVWTVWWFNVVLLILLLFVSFPYSSMRDNFDPELPQAIKDIGQLFRALEYEVVPSPVTGQPKIDPLLAGLDFFMHKKDQALAVMVRTEKSKLVDEWTTSSLLMSTSALEEFLREEQNGTAMVIPVIFLLGDIWKAEEKVIKTTDKQMDRIIEITGKISDPNSQKELKEIASRYLRIFQKETEDIGAPEDNLHISGGEA